MCALAGELRQSLPPMVVDILEDKLDTEYMDFASMCQGLTGGSYEGDTEKIDVPATVPQTAGSELDIPSHWVPMLEDKVCISTAVCSLTFNVKEGKLYCVVL